MANVLIGRDCQSFCIQILKIFAFCSKNPSNTSQTPCNTLVTYNLSNTDISHTPCKMLVTYILSILISLADPATCWSHASFQFWYIPHTLQHALVRGNAIWERMFCWICEIEFCYWSTLVLAKVASNFTELFFVRFHFDVFQP